MVKKVWFYDVRNDGYDPDRIQSGGRPETPEKSDIPALIAAWRSHKAKGFTNPPGVEAGSVFDDKKPEPHCWWAPLGTIAANDYNLAASSYKPQIGDEVPVEDPKQLIQEVLGIERKLEDGLAALLDEVEGS